MTRLWLIVVVLAGCRLTPIDLVGKACPCPAPLVCDETANQCVEPDAPVSLQSLAFSAGTLSPAFSPEITQYALELPITLAQVDVTPSLRGPPATLLVEGMATDSGATVTIDLLGRVDPIAVTLTEGGNATIYSVAVVRSHYLKPPAIEPDAFGSAVALGTTTAFGETLVVGAPNESSTGIGGPFDTLLTGAGAAFVYARVAGSWQEIAYLKAPVPQGAALFGSTVAISGDSIAVGASCENVVDDSGVLQTCAGAVHVYTWNGTTFGLDATIVAPKPRKSYRFGFSVAMADDTLVTGAISDATTGPTGSGAAYVYTRSAGVWSWTQSLKASMPTKNAQFGYAVALFGETIAVSARIETITALGQTYNNAGAVYLFDGSTGTWLAEARLAADVPATDQFGFSLALDGSTLAVGAPLESSAATGIDGDEQDMSQANNGAVYVYKRFSDGTWTRQAYVKATNEWPVSGGGIQFGRSVALAGDTLLVGGWTDRSASVGVDGPLLGDQQVGAGSAYLYARTNDAWMPSHFLKASNTGENDRFGTSVALSATSAIVGASLESVASAGVDGNQTTRTIPALGIGAVYAFPR